MFFKGLARLSRTLSTPPSLRIKSEKYIHIIPDFNDHKYGHIISDVKERDLFAIGSMMNVEHLSPSSFPDPPFPAQGIIHGNYCRLMVPLSIKKSDKRKTNPINCCFLVDTGSTDTYLSKRTVEALIGVGNVNGGLSYVTIQDPRYTVECRLSHSDFSDINLLGAIALRQLQLSIVCDWKAARCTLIRV